MSLRAAQPATPPIPVHLSAPEFPALLLPPLSMPTRGPKCTRGYPRGFHLILWVLDTGMPWQGLPVPTAPTGQPAMHSPTVDNVFATWADEGSLWQAFVACVAPLSAAQQLDRRGLQGDGTNPVATQGGGGWGTRALNLSKARRAWPSSTIMATSERLSPWLPSRSRTGSWCRRGCPPGRSGPNRWGETSEAPLSPSMVAVMRSAIGR